MDCRLAALRDAYEASERLLASSSRLDGRVRSAAVDHDVKVAAAAAARAAYQERIDEEKRDEANLGAAMRRRERA